MLQQTDVIAEFVGTLCDAGENVQHAGIHFSGIRLSGDRIAAVESHFFGDLAVDLMYLGEISVKELQEAGLCAGSSFGSQQLHGIQDVIQVFKIHKEILQPQRSTFADCRRLCRLEVGKSQSRLCFMFLCKVCQIGNDVYEFLTDQFQSFCHDDQVRVIANIAGGCAQVNDPFGFRALQSVSVYVGHDVVANDLLAFFGFVVVDIIGSGLQFCDLLVSDGKAQLLFRFCQCDPEFSPGPEFHFRGKEVFHLFARIPFRKGTCVALCVFHNTLLLLSIAGVLPGFPETVRGRGFAGYSACAERYIMIIP